MYPKSDDQFVFIARQATVGSSRSGIPIPVTDEEPEYEGFDENKPVEFVRKETKNLHTDKSGQVGTSTPRHYLKVDIAKQPNPCQRRGYTPISMEKQTRMNLEELQSLPDGATEPLYSNSELGDVEPDAPVSCVRF